MRKTLFLLTGLILFNLPFVPFLDSAQGDTETIPYLYYYSPLYSAIVVERGDGTDTHLLGQELMQGKTYPTAVRARDFGWSPSGLWYGWGIQASTKSSLYFQDTYVVESSGQKRIELLDEFWDAELLWSPVEDILLVVGATLTDNANQTGAYQYTTSVLIVDANTNTVLGSTPESYVFRSHFDRPTLSWTPDGRYAIVEAKNDDDSPYQFLIFDTQTRQFTRKSYPTLIPTRGDYYLPYSVSSIGWIAYQESEYYVLENLISGEKRKYSELVTQSMPKKNTWELDSVLYWSTDGQSGMVVASTGLWLISIKNDTLQLVSSDFKIDGWVNQADGKPEIMPVRWSPDNQHALISNETMLYHLDTQSTNAEKLVVFEEYSYSTVNWDWIDDAIAVVWVGQDATTYNFATEAVQVWNLPTQNELNLIKHYGNFQVTHDARYLAYVSDGAVIYDTQNQTYTTYRPHYDSYFSGPGGEVFLDASETWSIVREDSVKSSGGGGYSRQVGVIHLESEYQRDLATEEASELSNWLPKTVDVTKIPLATTPSPYPMPEKVLHIEEWMVYLEWSPDGETLIAGQGFFWGEEYSLFEWKIATQETNLIFETVTPEQEIEWQLNQTMFQPTLVDKESLEIPGLTDYFILVKSPDKQYALVYINGAYKVYEVRTGNLLWTLDRGLDLGSFSADNQFLIVSYPTNNYPIQIWDIATQQIVYTFPFSGSAFAFSPDGTQLAVAASWDILIYDLAELITQQ